MSISGASILQMVDIWALKQSFAAQQVVMQPNSNMTNAIVNQMNSLDPNVGQNLDISI